MYTIMRDQCSNSLPIRDPKMEVIGDFTRWQWKPVAITTRLIVRLHEERNMVSHVSLLLIMRSTISFTKILKAASVT